jgi:chromosome segregation ATPase
MESSFSSQAFPSPTSSTGEGNNLTDLNEISYLLNMTQNNQSKLDNENLELESLLKIEMNRFQNEKESYEEMIRRKVSLKDQGTRISDSIELTIIKLEQILSSLNRNDQMKVYINCVDEFLSQKSHLSKKIDDLRNEIDLLSSAVEILEEGYSSQLQTEVTELFSENDEKRKVIENLHDEISTLRPRSTQLADQAISCQQEIEDLTNQIKIVNLGLCEKKEEIMSINKDIEELKHQHEVSLDDLTESISELRQKLERKQSEIENVMSEVASSLSNLANTNSLLETVTRERAEVLENIQRLRMENERLKNERLELDDKIRQTEGNIRSTEAMRAVTESAMTAQQRITESYQEQSHFIVNSRRPMEQEIQEMSTSIEETKTLIAKLEEQV